MQIREQLEMPSQGDLLTNRYLYNGKEMQDDMGRISRLADEVEAGNLVVDFLHYYSFGKTD